jgi:hypothetical protein
MAGRSCGQVSVNDGLVARIHLAHDDALRDATYCLAWPRLGHQWFSPRHPPLAPTHVHKYVYLLLLLTKLLSTLSSSFDLMSYHAIAGSFMSRLHHSVLRWQ